MGRPRIYETDAERRAAHVRRNREYRRRLQQSGSKGVYPRHEDDLYVTPVEVIEAVLEMVTISPHSIMDVGANDGRWGLAAKRRWPEARILGVEKRSVTPPPGFFHWFTGDFMEGVAWLEWCQCDLIIGNPPYIQAERFVRGALRLLGPGGQLCFLLQSQFLHSKGRSEGLFAEHPLRRLYPLAARVSYHSGRGGTRDATAFLWEQGYKGPEEMFRGRY